MKSLIFEYNPQLDEGDVVDVYMNIRVKGCHITFIGEGRWLLFELEGHVYETATWISSDDYDKKFSDEEILSILEGILIRNSLEIL